MSHVTFLMSHCAYHMSYVKCWCSSLGHAEQLLFWCLCSKVSICDYVTCRMSHVACHMWHVTCEMLRLILGTCWTIFFSCLCSNVGVYGRKWQYFFLTATTTAALSVSGSIIELEASGIFLTILGVSIPIHGLVSQVQISITLYLINLQERWFSRVVLF